MSRHYVTISQVVHAIQPFSRTLLSPTLTCPMPRLLASAPQCSCALVTRACTLLCLALACPSASRLPTHVPRAHASTAPYACAPTAPQACASIAPMHLQDATHAVSHCLRPCHSVRCAATPQPTRQTCLVFVFAISTPILLPRLDTRPQAKPRQFALMTHGGDN